VLASLSPRCPSPYHFTTNPCRIRTSAFARTSRTGDHYASASHAQQNARFIAPLSRRGKNLHRQIRANFVSAHNKALAEQPAHWQLLCNQYFPATPPTAAIARLTNRSLLSQVQCHQRFPKAIVTAANTRLITLLDTTLTRKIALKPISINTFTKRRGSTFFATTHFPAILAANISLSPSPAVSSSPQLAENVQTATPSCAAGLRSHR
jgi:hypothetical protein